MKKSPFSTPRGNGGGRPSFGWKSGGSPGRGYRRPINYEYYSPNRSQTSSQNQSSSDDFIPFESCTPPSNDRKSGGNWQSPKAAGQWQGTGRGNRRNSVSGGYNSYNRDNRGRDNHQQTPYYKDGANSYHGQRKNFHRGSFRGRIDISRYMNLRSFLEDPWAELTRKLSSNDNCGDSLNDTSASDFSLNSSALDVVCLNDSVDEENLTSTDFSSQEEIDDNFIESEISTDTSVDIIISTSPESVDISLETSLDPKINKNFKDRHL